MFLPSEETHLHGTEWKLSIQRQDLNIIHPKENVTYGRHQKKQQCHKWALLYIHVLLLIQCRVCWVSIYVLHVLGLKYCAEHFHSCQLRWWGSGTLHLPWCFDLSSAATWNSHCNCTHLCLNTAITSVRLKKHQVSAALLHFANDELPSPFLSFVRKSYALMMYGWLVNFLSIQQPVCRAATAICSYAPLVIIYVLMSGLLALLHSRLHSLVCNSFISDSQTKRDRKSVV